jgi:hypothetical protein
MPVCLVHIDREATAQCASCFKPLCPDCVVRRGREVYCSPQCLANHLHSSGRIGRFLQHERLGRRREQQTRALALLVASLLLLLFGLFLVFV